jgi:hypothetical protein
VRRYHDRVFGSEIGDHPHIWGKLFRNMNRNISLSMKKGTICNYKPSNPQM